ncbi:similar to Saccharomyces cerevisiae YDR206W EBS1 Protein involved in inhibition of translation and nonsense-mediated decay [Maudiozyma saulgeensis]|uniref:Similar to Saccharomyces cerevisiae YDR206W EBS1 Protein involved in inhibition of translation and nonsense-mediated decay n=1 Tax=Maudiozyma saulgeensis TaxID=1789683 RepID=A0A1X7RAU4_9SACH|nr:similar to Saccharomyces cerevisiae YDR206W EBS1 Protein involved in inhibition of translation and nonsense-mediated decay [Kazachstania saulgeensis]
MVSKPNVSETKRAIDKYHNEVTRLTCGDLFMREDYNTSIKIVRDIHTDIYKVFSEESLIYFVNMDDFSQDDDTYLGDQLNSILDEIWSKIQKPLFIWFQAWKQSLPKERKGQRKVFVERRKLLYRLKRLFKIMHRFYYAIIEKFVIDFNIGGLIPTQIIQELNIDVSFKIDNPTNVLQIDQTRSAILTETIYQCIFYIGKIHYWQVLLETREKNISIGKFHKSKRYLEMASLLLPSYGKTYSQISLLYLKSNNAFMALYYSIRGLGARIRHKHSMLIFKSILSERVIDKSLDDTDEIRRMKIEEAFLLILKYYFYNNHSKTIIVNKINHFFFTDDKLSEGPNKDGTIFKMIIILAGCLHERMPKDGTRMKSFDVSTLTEKQKRYLNWSFDFASKIFGSIIVRNCKEKFSSETGSLGTLRFIMCWIKSNKPLLQYTHRNEGICKILAESVNTLHNYDIFGINVYAEHRPERPYLFPEDILVRELSYIRYRLSDFNDKNIFEHKDILNQLFDGPRESTKLSAYSENLSRLTAIILSIIKFLTNNKLGIKWNLECKKFEFDSTTFEPIKKEREIISLDEVVDSYQRKIHGSNGKMKQVIDINTLINELSPRRKKQREQRVQDVSPRRLKFEDELTPQVQGSTGEKIIHNGIDLIQDQLLSSDEDDAGNLVVSVEESLLSSLINDGDAPSLDERDKYFDMEASSILDMDNLINEL